MTRRESSDPRDRQIRDLERQVAMQGRQLSELAERFEQLREEALMIKRFQEMRLDYAGYPPVPRSVRRRVRPGLRHLHPVSGGS